MMRAGSTYFVISLGTMSVVEYAAGRQGGLNKAASDPQPTLLRRRARLKGDTIDLLRCQTDKISKNGVEGSCDALIERSREPSPAFD